MTSPTLPVSRVINVSVNLSPSAAQAQSLSTLLLLGSSDVINTQERFRSYPDIESVAADFGTTAPEYLGAVLWFEQSPQPSTLAIGRWAKTPTNGVLVGVFAQRPMARVDGCGDCSNHSTAPRYSGAVVPKSAATLSMSG